MEGRGTGRGLSRLVTRNGYLIVMNGPSKDEANRSRFATEKRHILGRPNIF